MIITGKDCENCIYGTLFENDNGILKSYCRNRDKEYYYGTSIPCEDRRMDNGKTEEIYTRNDA